MVFGGSGVIMLKHPKEQPVAPIESFTRFQLAAIIDSSIHRFIGSGGWAGWLAAGFWLDGEEEGFQGSLTRSTLWRGRRISCIFMDFDVFLEIS